MIARIFSKGYAVTESKVSKYLDIERQMSLLMQQQEELAKNPVIKAKIAALDQIDEIIKSSGLTAEDVAMHLGFSSTTEAQQGYIAKNPRRVKEYLNPHTGEVFSGKKVAGKLKDWIDEHGAETVETWRTN
jgi:DNA-binding protein H-NS